MCHRRTQVSRPLLACVVGGVAIMLALVLHVLVVGPYLEAKRLVQNRLIQGRPIVQAAYEFQRSNGRWPDTIEELVPEFLHEVPPIEGNWRYATSANEPPVLSGDAGSGNRLKYGFPPRTPAILPHGTDHGWIIDGRNGASFVATD
jgi:hypothetical protein